MRSLGFSAFVTVLFVALHLFPTRAIAQETTGSLEGRLFDAKGKPVGYAYVIVTGQSIQGKRGTVTTLDGRFVVLALPVGECDVKFAHVSYVEQVFQGVRIRLGQRTPMGDVVLEDKVHEVQGVTVTGNAPPLLDATSTQIGGTLRREDYEALPIDRDYRSVATLFPEVNESFLTSLGGRDPENFAGATGLENRYFIDGIDASDSYRGASSTRLPYNFIQEVQLRTGGYEAEYRSSLGGTVNVITYSGGNKTTGNLFGFFTNNALTATPRSVPGSPNTGDFSRWDVGLGVGGPIAKDRLWYYAAYNPVFQTEDVEIPGFGFYDDDLTTHSFAGKLTWRTNDKNTLTLTGIADPTEGLAVRPPIVTPENVDPFLSRLRSGGLGVMLEGRHLVSDNFFFKSSISWLRRDDENLPDTERGEELNFLVDSTGVESGGVFETADDNVTVALAGLACTWLRGDHEVKFGVEYKETRLKADQTKSRLIAYAPDDYFLIDIAFLGAEVGNRIPSVFLQDSWRIADRLFINAGLRWDGQYLIGSSGDVAQKILDQWQPRAGITYQLGPPGTQKVFASFGRYYQELMTSGPMWYFNEGQRFLLVGYDHDPRFDSAGGDTLAYAPGEVQPENDDLEGQYFDEFTLGYERRIGRSGRFGVRGIYRSLGQGIEDGLVDPATDTWVWGNPGSGELSAFPRMKRNYSALELTFQQRTSNGLSFLASYVLSRSYGNYAGLFDSEYGNPYPNATGVFDTVDGLVNGEGLLPNDRTHVFKLSGSYRLGAGVSVGASGVWESGTPLNEFGSDPLGPPWQAFLQERGTAGRTPAIWDVSMRVTYEPSGFAGNRWRPRLTADFLHIGSEREAVDYDQVHYTGVDSEGNQIYPNPTYGQPIAYQPPMVVRLGLDLQF